ncbi:uncharacterized protein LOC126888244 [Diabrotica virgifera virgifera]|uniref:Uncharacterized protein n=1 Tax=Diabrotica virgifera virgifera TaxID=50390 RepID=A0ABM5KQ28_DIAVI|nr:uncharacterized protein LOC126888244 [Diabrotica virgifera virgifera]
MSKTIITLIFVCCIVAHVQCKTFIECLDTDNKGVLTFDEQISSSSHGIISEQIPAGMFKSQITCIVIYFDNNITPVLTQGGVGARYVGLRLDFSSVLQSTYRVQIYTSEPEDYIPK